jgi:4-amino-4-deoxy-L-arabinose transferase-like glycosyltransferase
MSLDARPGRRLLVAAAVLGLLLRLAFSFLYWVGKPLTHDEREYLELARSLAAGRGFVYSESYDSGTAQQFGRAPGYPLFLAATGAGRAPADGVPASVKISQAAVGAVAVWLIGVLASRWAGPRAGIVAAAVAAVYPPLVWIAAYALSETLYAALALGAVLLVQIAADRSAAEPRSRASYGFAAAAGSITGAAILVRPAMLFFLPLALVWLALRRRALTAALLLLVSIAVVTPWTIRNARVYGRFVLVASEGGVTFWTGNHPLAKGEGDLAANPEIKRAELEFRRAHAGLTAEQLEPLYYRDALAHISAHPFWWAGLLARKAVFTVIPTGPSYTLHSSRYRVASVASYLLLLPFAAAGAVRQWRSPRRPVALLLLAASAVLVSLIFFPQERFRIPVFDPVLIVCAGALAGRRGIA